jgi:hypothetical protein
MITGAQSEAAFTERIEAALEATGDPAADRGPDASRKG